MAQDGGWVGDVAAPGPRLELVGLIGFEVAGVLVDLDPGAQAGRVQFGMELGGVDAGADPERLHRAPGGAGEQDGVARQPADRLLVADERVKGGGQPAQQRVPPALTGERDRDGADRLGVPPVDHGPLMAAEGSDAVASPEEREVRADHLFEQPPQVGLDPPLHRRFLVLRVAGVERPAAQQDPGPVPQVDVAQRLPLEPVTVQVTLVQPGKGQERLVLVVRGGILSPDGQQQERLHKIILVSSGAWLSRYAKPLLVSQLGTCREVPRFINTTGSGAGDRPTAAWFAGPQAAVSPRSFPRSSRPSRCGPPSAAGAGGGSR